MKPKHRQRTKMEFLNYRKTLIYQLCDFLLDLRKDTDGLRTSLKISLPEMSELFRYIDQEEDDEEKINTLGLKILLLCRDTVIVDGYEHPVIRVLNPEILESFPQNFNDGGVIEISCSSEGLEIYKEKLKEGTEKLFRANEGVRIERTASGGVKIFLGEKSMEIKPGRNGVNVRSALVQLMFGESVGIGNDAISVSSYAKYEDYEKGDVVECDDLQNMMLRISGLDEHPRDSPKIKVRAISDAARDLNEIVSTELGKPIFEYNPSDGTLEWVL